MQHGEQKSERWDIHPGPSAVNVSVQQASPDDSGDKIDMFGDDENANENLPVPSAEQADQPTSGSLGSSQDLGSGGIFFLMYKNECPPLTRWLRPSM